MKEGQTLITFIWPAQNPELMQSLAARKVTVLAMDGVPRLLSRAQKMDALTSMAGIAGYRAVIEAANAFGRYFNGQITAAGKVPPAKVFVAGAGVAGLAAIGTAVGPRRHRARQRHARRKSADQVKSMGGEFVKVDYEEEGSGGGGYAKVMSEGFQKAQREMYAKQARDVDIIITTALIPGKPAPKLITAEMVQSMKPGSVIVDLAAEQGGNCELTEPGKVVVKHGVTIVGYTDLPSRLAKQSSTLYANNLLRLTEELCKTKDGHHQRQHGRRCDPRLDRDQGRGRSPGRRRRSNFPPRRAAQAARRCRVTRRPATARQRAGDRGTRRGDIRRRALVLFGSIGAIRAGGVPRPLHGVRAGGLRRLHGGVERHPRPAHAADERHQRDFQHHRHRRADADRAAADPRTGAPGRLILLLAVVGHRAHLDQHVRRLRGHAAHAGDVPQVRGPESCPKSRNGLLYRSDHSLHPQPRRSLQPGDLAARQLVRHDRHDHRRAGHGVRPARRRSAAATPWIIGAMAVGGSIGLYRRPRRSR